MTQMIGWNFILKGYSEIITQMIGWNLLYVKKKRLLMVEEWDEDVQSKQWGTPKGA